MARIKVAATRMLHGIRTIQTGDFVVDENPALFGDHVDDEGRWKLFLAPKTNVDTIFGTNVESGNNRTCLEVYTYLEPHLNCVAENLEVVQWDENDSCEVCSYHLDTTEQRLITKMAQNFMLRYIGELVDTPARAIKPECRRYMRYSKRLASFETGKVYRLIEDMPPEGDYVRCVDMDNWERYRLLRAWSHNQVGVTVEQEAEMNNYGEMQPIDKLEPYETITIKGPDYAPRLYVRDLDYIVINGKRTQVYWIDSCHFGITYESGHSDTFHIDEFAELCEKNNVNIERGE